MWYLSRCAALLAAVPPPGRYLQYGSPTAVPRTNPLLRLGPDALAGLPATGRMYSWMLQLPAVVPAPAAGAGAGAGRATTTTAAHGWVAAVSGSLPCTGFRVWAAADPVVLPAPPPGQQATGEEAAARWGGATVEVTGLAAPLPALHPEGRWPVRDVR